MSGAGYGNHEPSPVASRGESADPNAASQKPAAGSTDRAGLDLGGAGDLASPSGQGAGSHATPDPSGQGPHSGLRESNSPVLTEANDDPSRAPGTGALPTNPQGDEVDPGGG